MSNFEPTLASIHQAYDRIGDLIVRTPVVAAATIGEQLGCQLLLKCESLQYCGAFKSRGACNAVFSLTDKQAAHGVCAHSSGNHAAALARAARLRGIPAHIVMPLNSLPYKLQAVRDLGVEPILSGPTPAERQSVAEQVLVDTGATLIHPYDDDRVIAGQATVALELLDQIDPPDVLLVPLGGGGLLAGTLLTVKALAPAVQVIGVEPAWADDGFRSLKAGKIQQPTRYDTVADGLRTSLGERTFPIIQRLVDDVMLCSEEIIEAAMEQLLNLAKLVVEPSGAVPLAAVMNDPGRFAGRRVALIVSGGNIPVRPVAESRPLAPREDGT
jgi:threonine dehydratase